MRFADKLRQLMNETGLTQAQIASMTGIGRSGISQYVSGKNEPTKARKREMAVALGLSEDYFEPIIPPDIDYDRELPNTTTAAVAAKLLGVSDDCVKKGLEEGAFPWGYAVHMKRTRHIVLVKKFEEHTGIKIPVGMI